MFPESLAEDAVDRLLFDLDRESRGILRNRTVRQYLRELPPGITKQGYVLRVNGLIRREVHFTSVSFAMEINESPYLIEITGSVIGVGFDPGRHFVKVKSSDSSGSEFTLAATSDQVDIALEDRASNVRILAMVTATGKKLLRIQRASDRKIQLDTNRYVFQRWSNLLARLAQ